MEKKTTQRRVHVIDAAGRSLGRVEHYFYAGNKIHRTNGFIREFEGTAESLQSS